MSREATCIEHTRRRVTEETAIWIIDERPHQHADAQRTDSSIVRSARKPLRKHRLRIHAQLIELGDAMHTADGAVRSAALHSAVLPLQILDAVSLQRNTWIATLLRTPVHQSVFAHI